MTERTNDRTRDASASARFVKAAVVGILMLAPLLASAYAQQTTIRLLDGSTCLHAGFGATLAIDGDRLSYTCDRDTALVGDPTWSGDQLTVARVRLDTQASPVALIDRRTLTSTAGSIRLVDGTSCRSTGHGATLTLGSERLSYSCGDGEIGVVGDHTNVDGVFSVHLAAIVTTAAGTELREAGRADVAEIDGRSRIASGQWRLTTFGRGSNATVVDEETAPTMLVDAGQVSGSASCNSYFGQVTLGTYGAIAFGPMGSTMMACQEPLMAQEQRFLQALQQVRFYYFAESELRMYGAETLVFQPVTSD